jgi:hypothetical protein
MCHAALVPRMMLIADRPLRAGYVEAVATRSDQRRRGASYAQMAHERVRTPEDDNGLMVLRTSRTLLLDLSGDIVADWREGDVW